MTSLFKGKFIAARRGQAWPGGARPSSAWRGEAWLGMARLGEAWRGHGGGGTTQKNPHQFSNTNPDCCR